MANVPPGLSGKTFQLVDDLDPGAAHEPDPLEARVIALEARVAAIEAVVGMALARPRSTAR